jgi:hypothetical protein
MNSLDEPQKSVMKLAILNSTKTIVLKAKLDALSSYTNDRGNNGYYALQKLFGSPTKTPNSSQDEEVPTTPSLPTKPSDDVDEILPPLDDSEQDEPSEEENINNTIFDNFYSKVTRFVSSLFYEEANKVVPVDETQVVEIVNKATDEIVNNATQEINKEIQQRQYRPTEYQPTRREKGIATVLFTNITTNYEEKTSIISWIKETLHGYYFPSDPNMVESGGSRKYHRTPHKSVTRRKNKKSPKRKTIKKRKIPKRKNKTRRQRK